MLTTDNRLSAELERDLAMLEADDAPLAWWRQQVALGALSVIAVHVAGEHVGSVLWRLETHGGRPCFVIAGAAGNHPRFDLMGSVLPALEDHARRLGCALVRFHTRRRGLAARAEAMGYGAAERVLLKAVA